MWLRNRLLDSNMSSIEKFTLPATLIQYDRGLGTARPNSEARDDGRVNVDERFWLLAGLLNKCAVTQLERVGGEGWLGGFWV